MQKIEKGKGSVKTPRGPLLESKCIHIQVFDIANRHFFPGPVGVNPAFDIPGEGHNKDRPPRALHPAGDKLWLGSWTDNNLYSNHRVRPSGHLHPQARSCIGGARCQKRSVLQPVPVIRPREKLPLQEM